MQPHLRAHKRGKYPAGLTVEDMEERKKRWQDMLAKKRGDE